MQVVQVQSLIGELRPHLLHGTAKKKKIVSPSCLIAETNKNGNNYKSSL